MTPISPNSMQLSVDTLFNPTSFGMSSTSSNTGILNSITDRYLASSMSSEAIMTDLSGLSAAQGTSLQSLLQSQENSDIIELLSANLSSQQQSVLSILSGDSVSNEREMSKALVAINRATIANPLVLLGDQDSSIGGMLDLYA